MVNIAKLISLDQSQAVLLPVEYRFKGTEVLIRRDTVTGDVVLSSHPESWDDLFALDAMQITS